jgi:hypothetical protein
MHKSYIFNDLCGLGAHGVRHPSGVRIEFSKTPEKKNHFYTTCLRPSSHYSISPNLEHITNENVPLPQRCSTRCASNHGHFFRLIPKQSEALLFICKSVKILRSLDF